MISHLPSDTTSKRLINKTMLIPTLEIWFYAKSHSAKSTSIQNEVKAQYVETVRGHFRKGKGPFCLKQWMYFPAVSQSPSMQFLTT